MSPPDDSPEIASTSVANAALSSHGTVALPPPPEGHHQSLWLWVMCLTGVDYFSTLGYQPAIAYTSAGLLAPIATVVLVLVTLLGAYPVYAFVAKCSAEGQGSIGMLARLVSGWGGKILILTLLGFAATDFVITKTLSAADAGKHLIENPHWPLRSGETGEGGGEESRQQLFLTLGLLTLLGLFFLRGMREVISLAVVITAVYLTLSALIVGAGLLYIAQHPILVENWWNAVRVGDWHLAHNPAGALGRGAGFLPIAVVVLVIFPKLALGLSGFETGVAVMPLIRGDGDDTRQNPAGRVRNTRKLLLVAALIMSVMLMGSSVVVSLLIPPQDLLLRDPARPGQFLDPSRWDADGPKGVERPKLPAASGRALAYLAHGEGESLKVAPFFGDKFGTLYDLSTVVILWFAGASAMAGLLNIVPKYLPRYGMAPEWANATRPLVVLLTGINWVITFIFDADVDAQGDAYATGVLVLMCSACVASLIEKWRAREGNLFGRRLALRFVGITLVFVYTTLAVIWEKPVGMIISLCFIGTIILTSFVSRVLRSRELRFAGFALKDAQSKLLWDTIRYLDLTVLVPHRPGRRSLAEKEGDIRREHRVPRDLMVVFVEVNLADASNFVGEPVIEIHQEEGRYILKISGAASIAHTLAAVSLEMAKVGHPPEIHFGWTEDSPWSGTLGFLLFGEGNVPWMVRELLRRAEPDPAKRPHIIVAGV